MPLRDQLYDALQTIIVPLVHADGGHVYLVRLAPDEVVLHLAGTCAGCPGATLTARGVIEPLVHTYSPHARVTVTTGFHIPEGAARLEEKVVA